MLMQNWNRKRDLSIIGAVCDVNIDECATMEPCLNNATCVDLLNAYRCECTVGFNGKWCCYRPGCLAS
jgi:EGF-like domain